MDIKELKSFRLADSVKFHDELNPKLFSHDKIIPEIRKQLMLIADDFITELGIPSMHVKDVQISGSNAAYSYTKHSDLDLHIVVDMEQFANDAIYRELFNAKKKIYNESHDITIRQIPVELYVQDAEQPGVSLGEYSVLKDDWIKFPSKRRANFDQLATVAKYEKLGEFIEHALRTKSLAKVTKALDIIKRYRRAGLDNGGEFGPENLAYKTLKTQGLIQKLFDLKDSLHSDELSIEGMYVEATKKTKSVLEFAKPECYDRELLTEALEEYFKKDGRWYPHRVHGVCSAILQHNKLMESSYLDEIKEFWNRLKELDHRASIKISIGSKVSVLQMWTHGYNIDKVFEFRGHLDPKKIVDIDSDGSKIETIWFEDGSSFPDRSFIDRDQGGELDGIITLFFNTKDDASHALDVARLIMPDGWKISTKNLKENIGDNNNTDLSTKPDENIQTRKTLRRLGSK